MNEISQLRIHMYFCPFYIVVYYFLGKNGFSVPIGSDGSTKHFYGVLISFLADTLAAHDIGGFKVGVGFALRKCRMCLATAEDLQAKVIILISC